MNLLTKRSAVSWLMQPRNGAVDSAGAPAAAQTRARTEARKAIFIVKINEGGKWGACCYCLRGG